MGKSRLPEVNRRCCRSGRREGGGCSPSDGCRMAGERHPKPRTQNPEPGTRNPEKSTAKIQDHQTAEKTRQPDHQPGPNPAHRKAARGNQHPNDADRHTETTTRISRQKKHPPARKHSRPRKKQEARHPYRHRGPGPKPGPSAGTKHPEPHTQATARNKNQGKANRHEEPRNPDRPPRRKNKHRITGQARKPSTQTPDQAQKHPETIKASHSKPETKKRLANRQEEPDHSDRPPPAARHSKPRPAPSTSHAPPAPQPHHRRNPIPGSPDTPRTTPRAPHPGTRHPHPADVGTSDGCGTDTASAYNRAPRSGAKSNRANTAGTVIAGIT